MKGIGKYASLFVAALALGGLLFLGVPQLAAQSTTTSTSSSSGNNSNLAPCDFSDQFYSDNGLDPTQLVLRFGSARQFGPPARKAGQANWVADNVNCTAKDPTRRNFRILATTGGNADDGNSPFSCVDQNGQFAVPQCASQSALEPETFEFISILAFVTNQTNFEDSYIRNVGFINGGLQGVQQNPGEDISIGQASKGEAPAQTLRGFAMQDIVGNFEAYAAIKQRQPDGTFATNPCAADMQSDLAPPTPCFDVGAVNGVKTVFTPNLTQDWRFATNRNAIDGSDGNDPFNPDPTAVNNAPFGYFCDDLLGMWIITYFWLTQDPLTTDPNSTCGKAFAAMSAKNGKNLDGGPIILTAHELNDEIEGNNCGAEGQEAVDGSDGGAIWLVCPAIPDPRNGAIASDAFLDQVIKPNGVPQNLALTANFLSLQIFGKFANELTSSQQTQLASAVASTH
jgi:hypothetical protein